MELFTTMRVDERRLVDLVDEQERLPGCLPPCGPASGGWRREVLCRVRAELDVLEADGDRPPTWGRDGGRIALARAVALLRELDRELYRTY
jgi:hypothetical protein